MSYVYGPNLTFFCGICNTCLMYFVFSLFRTKKAGENCALFFPARCILIPFEWLLTFYSPTALSPLLSRPAPYKPSGVSKAPACYTSDASPLHTGARWVVIVSVRSERLVKFTKVLIPELMIGIRDSMT